MKALSVHPICADEIVSGLKTIEIRTWKTEYRGDILICSTAKKYHGTIPGHALGVVKLVDVRPLKKSDCEAAMMSPSDFEKGLYAWVLDDNRLIEPIPVKGKLSLWNFDEEEKIKYIPLEEWVGDENEEPGAWYDKYWKPLMI